MGMLTRVCLTHSDSHSMIIQSKCHHLPFTDKETEALRSEVIRPSFLTPGPLASIEPGTSLGLNPLFFFFLIEWMNE